MGGVTEHFQQISNQIITIDLNNKNDIAIWVKTTISIIEIILYFLMKQRKTGAISKYYTDTQRPYENLSLSRRIENLEISSIRIRLKGGKEKSVDKRPQALHS